MKHVYVHNFFFYFPLGISLRKILWKSIENIYQSSKTAAYKMNASEWHIMKTYSNRRLEKCNKYKSAKTVSTPTAKSQYLSAEGKNIFSTSLSQRNLEQCHFSRLFQRCLFFQSFLFYYVYLIFPISHPFIFFARFFFFLCPPPLIFMFSQLY